MTRRRHHRSFTLIELISVIAILGIISVSVGVPTMAHIGRLRSDAASSRLASDIRYIQRLAMASGLRTWIDVDDAADRYSLYIENPASPGKAGRVAVAHPLDLSTNAIQFNAGAFGGVTIDLVSFNSMSELEFDNFGVPSDSTGAALSTPGIVVLSNGAAVRVFPVGGYVEHRSWP